MLTSLPARHHTPQPRQQPLTRALTGLWLLAMAQPLAAAAAIRQAAIPERQAAAAINRALPPDTPSPTSLGHQPQVHPASPIAQQPPRQPATLEELARQVDALVEKGDLKGATLLLQRIAPELEQLFGPEYVNTAHMFHLQGVLLYRQGRFGEAIPLINRSLAIRETVLGREHPETANSLTALALLYQGQGRYGEAEPLFKRSLAIHEKVLGPKHPSTAGGLTNLASLYQRQGRYGEAEPLFKRALAIHEKVLGLEHPDTATIIGNLASLLYFQGRFREAEQLFKRSLAINEKVMGQEHPNTANDLTNLALLYNSQARYSEAEPLLKRSLAIVESMLGPEHPNTANNLANLASLYQSQARYGEAEPLFKRSLAIAEKVLGPEHPYTANSLANLALLYQSQARYSEAEPLLKRSLAIDEKVLGPEHPETAQAVNHLAALYSDQGRYSEAEPLIKRSQAIREKALGMEHPSTAASINALAMLYDKQSRYSEAELLFRRSLTILENTLGPEHPGTAQVRNNLAGLYSYQGRYSEAEPLLKYSQASREKTLGMEHPDTAEALANVANLYYWQGRYSEAEAQFKRSLAIYEKVLGTQHPTIAQVLNNLAVYYTDLSRYSEAEPLLKRSLAIREKALGMEHPDTAQSLTNLARLYGQQSRYREADPPSKRSLAINETMLGANHPSTATSLNIRALLLLLQNNTRDAAPLISRLVSTQAEWLRRELPLQPRALRMGLLQKQPEAVAASFALLDQDPAAAALALESRLNRQGLLAEIEQRQRLLLGSSAQVRQLGERLAGLDRQLASINLTPAQRDGLRLQRQQLEAELNRLLPTLRIEPVSTARVAAALNALAPQGLLVEFQKYRPWGRTSSGKADWGPPRYVALLLHPDGRIIAFPLGAAAPIDQAIEKALAASAANSADADDLWSQVSALMFNPLAPELRGVRELFLSPDGALHRVPYAALPAPASGDQRLNQAFQLRLLTTGRELIRLQQPAATGSAPVLIANPDYNALRRSAAARGTAGANGSAERKPGAAATPPITAPSERQQRSGTLAATKAWAPLPGTAEEARLLGPLLGIPQPITGAAANAPLVLRQNAPRILHIATHGFFQADLPDRPADPLSGTGSGSAPAAAGQEDPLLRSGLVLAGANHPEADPTDDGYLTAAEVTGINLKGTQLVTLSACESGLGDLQSGEGVYGLQRSLAVAGARSTLLSLWQVDDDATRAFMQAFYGRLLRGEGRADALAHTQAEFRNHPNPLYRDLYVWAAFQLTGDWRPISSGR